MHPRLVRRLALRAVTCAAALCATLGALTACTADDTPMATPTETPTTTVVPTPTSSPTPAAPALVPNGTAQENLPIFSEVTHKVWAGKDKVHGRAYVDALVKAGFDKKAMQVTEDHSTVGNAAESLQFSVRWKDGQCLVGQVGPETGKPVTTVLPGLADGSCLLGKTRDIDW